MKSKYHYDVIIVGGSYAGLAATMALGRALKKVLIIDSELPCNRQTPYSHNFLTNDGNTPKDIAALARLQVGRYPTVSFLSGRVISGKGDGDAFEVFTEAREIYSARKLIFATGIRDILAPIDGLAACWGISVIHCPYCHGYEVKGEPTGLLSNGEAGFDFARLISNWTTDLTLFTNGISILSGDQQVQLVGRGIAVVEKEVSMLEQDNGQLRNVLFSDGSAYPLKVLYAPGSFEQHCKVPEEMGCELTEEGILRLMYLVKQH
ncbi:NAD(P)/FAD-dependent oxidoreductase [Pedobacter heparinus]|uniref:NAD(P)/FAD-dependent oxidoreductase n=1 Tax=Pedobacter heparinus TaxID=984 RepID=UPI002930E7E7|nr:NAD(P)/FAD-dependent oxidoreductase [Pedobacter heparinus]